MNIHEYEMAINGAKGSLAQEFPASTQAAAGETSQTGFHDMLNDLVHQVDALQKNADASINGLVSGATTNVHDVTVKMAEAGVAFDLMMQVRNKLLDAYQQIIKMQA